MSKQTKYGFKYSDGSIRYRKGENRYEARMVVTDMKSKKKENMSFYGLTEPDAIKKMNDYKSNLCKGIHSFDGTLSSYIEKYLILQDEYKFNDEEIALFRELNLKYIKHSIINNELKYIKQVNIQAFLSDLKANYEPLLVRKGIHSLLSQTFAFAIKRKAIKINPITGIKKPQY